jgi:hypothetical protein
MKGSTHSIYVVLGCAAVLAGTSACSQPKPEPVSPTLDSTRGSSSMPGQSQTSSGGSNAAQPGFDSDRDTQSGTSPSGSPQGQPGAMQQGIDQGQPGAMQPGTTTQPTPQGTGLGATPQGAQGPQPGGPGTISAPPESVASINEREACDLLMSEAMLHMEPIEGGVAIVAKPRRTSDVSTVRSRMQSIHHGIERGGPSSATATCELFALGRNGVASLIETPDSIRLLVTTSDAARVPQLRRQANEFIRSKNAPAPKGSSPRGGTPHGGTQGGGTPQHSDETPQGGTP